MKGYSLIEMLIYMALVSVFIIVVSLIFNRTFSLQKQTSQSSLISEDSKVIIARLSYDLHRASEIVTPATPSASLSQSLQLQIGSDTYQYLLQSNNLILQINGVSQGMVNTSSTKVSSLTFERIGNGDTLDTIKVHIALTSPNNLVPVQNYDLTLGER